MTTHDQDRRELVERFKLSDTTVLFDVFAESVSTVQGLYVAKMRAAGSADEDARWTERAVALRQYKRSVGPDNRDAMIDGILRMRAERASLTGSGPAASVA